MSASCQPRSGERSQEGFILVTVLWILIALATLASIASLYVAQSAVALRASDEALRSEAAITAGLGLTAYQLSASTDGRRPTRGGFRFRLPNCDVNLEFMSEAARINLNAAPKAMIAGLFMVLGAQAEAADNYADRIVAWRSAPKSQVQNEEAAFYRAAGLLYGPRGGPFNHIDELWLVINVPPVLIERALPHVTLFSDMPDVNVLDAAPEVIASLPGMTPIRLKAFLSQRDTLSPDPQIILGALGGKQVGATVSGSNAYRVRMRLTFPDRRQKTAEVVIMLTGITTSESYRVLSWKDDINMATGAPFGPEATR
jgi:general secretion pathway protein K